MVVAPVALFVLGVTMASCGGGSSCFGSFNNQGLFIPGLCPTASPSPGFALQSINICAFPSRTPTPTPTNGEVPTPTKTPKKTATPTPTFCPQTGPTGVATSGVTINFIANGLLAKGTQTTFSDITNAPSTLWTSSNPSVLQPPTSAQGGQYTGLTTGCACIGVSSGGINAEEVAVSVSTPVAQCPACPTLTPTATATPKAATAQEAGASRASTFSGGTVVWTFEASGPVIGPIVSGPEGTVNFITGDSMLHSLDARGHQIFDRPAGGLAPAVGPDGTIYAQGTTSWIYALDNRGRPIWKAQVGSGNGPLAADSSAVYANESGNLIALGKTGNTLWSVPLGSPNRGAIISDGVVVASNGGSLVALTQNGSTMWVFSPAGGFSGELVAANGLVYAGSASGSVYAVDATNGSIVWQTPGGAAVTSGPTLTSTGGVVYGSDALYAVDSNGVALWSSKPLTPLAHGLAGLSNGTIFDATATTDPSSSMLDLDGNIEWTARDLGDVTQVSPGQSGTVYVGALDGRVRSLR